MSIARRVYQRYIQATISVPPRKFGDLLRRVEKKITDGTERLGTLAETLDKAQEEANDFSYVMRNLEFDHYDLRMFADQAQAIQKSVAGSIQYVLTTEGARFQDALGYLTDHVEYALKENLKLQKFSAVPEVAAEKAAEGSSFPPELITAYQGTIRAARDIVEALLTCQDALRRYVEYRKSLSEAGYGVTAPLPKHEKIEKLYHASINARSLYEHGFSASRPEGGGMGLGGSVEDKSGNKAISFTYDLKYALEIARWFKEMALVVQGHIKPSQVFEWANSEGVADETYEAYKNLYDISDSSVSSFNTKGSNTLVRRGGKWKVVFEKWNPAKSDYDESEGDIDAIFKSKKDTYHLYAAFLQSNRHRENPVGIETDQLLDRMEKENVNPRDIGVIVAEVDMADPDIAHYPAERELRVPAKAIQKVIKFV